MPLLDVHLLVHLLAGSRRTAGCRPRCSQLPPELRVLTRCHNQSPELLVLRRQSLRGIELRLHGISSLKGRCELVSQPTKDALVLSHWNLRLALQTTARLRQLARLGQIEA